MLEAAIASAPTLGLILVAAAGAGLTMREAVLIRLDPAPRAGRLPVLAVLAASAPLLGLLGTVIGLVTAFSRGDATSTAGGIGQALTTTQAGLAIGIPLLLARQLLLRAGERQRARRARQQPTAVTP